MPTTACQLYSDFKGKNNTWQNGHYRSQSFLFALYEAILEIFNENKALLGQSQQAEDNLRFFYTRAQFPVNDYPTGGIIPYPDFYSMFSSLRYYSKEGENNSVLCCDIDIIDKGTNICRPLREEEKQDAMDDTSFLIERTIKKVHPSKWGALVSHETKKPTIGNPYCTQTNEGFMVSPKLSYVVLYYLSTPQRPIMKLVLDERQNEVCKDTSVIPFGDEMIPDLMSRVKKKYASFISDQQKYTEGEKETQAAG